MCNINETCRYEKVEQVLSKSVRNGYIYTNTCYETAY